MNTLYKRPANDTYQSLDDVQKEYINILRSTKTTPAEVEDSLIEFFQYSTDKMLTPTKICDTISDLIDNEKLLSDAVIKMAKNQNGITGFIIDLQDKPRFMSEEAWQTLKNKPTTRQTAPLKQAISA